jgi:hypothetical protein
MLRRTGIVSGDVRHELRLLRGDRFGNVTDA